MEKPVILLCAYREWALDIARHLEKTFADKAEFRIITSDEEFNKVIPSLSPSLIFFIGWSWILPKDIVNSNACYCLHPSPLPKYRGGSPLQHQIIKGEPESAVTLFRMDEQVDKGPIAWQKSFSLNGDLKDLFGSCLDFSRAVNMVARHRSTLYVSFNGKPKASVFGQKQSPAACR